MKLNFMWGPGWGLPSPSFQNNSNVTRVPAPPHFQLSSCLVLQEACRDPVLCVVCPRLQTGKQGHEGKVTVQGSRVRVVAPALELGSPGPTHHLAMQLSTHPSDHKAFRVLCQWYTYAST